MNVMNIAQAIVFLSYKAEETQVVCIQWRRLALQMGATADDPISTFPDGSAVCWTNNGIYAKPIEYIGG